MQKKVCVIGAGASGLAGIKCCLDAGFQVICYEQSGHIGGLWKYRDDDVDGLASVAKSTIINSSKEMSAYSDFPPPCEFANYMHNTQMYAYFVMYAETFGLRKHIRNHHKVIRCEKADDFEKTGRWIVTAANTLSNNMLVDVFDGVLVCTGHHVQPLVPHFKNQEKFRGTITHSHSYKKPTLYENMSVVVVGIGNSGGDIAVELSGMSKKVYHSFRRGTWITWRVGSQGQPMDAELIRRYIVNFLGLFPLRIRDSIIEYMATKRVDHVLYRLKPAHGWSSQHVFVNDALPNRIISGTVVLKGTIKEFTEDGVIFENETKETQVDAVVLATGYDISFPFLDKSIIWSEKNRISLYKHVFSPRLSPHANTIAFVGLIQPIGPLIPISELQCRWFCELMKGSTKLPSEIEMLRDIEQKDDLLDRRYYKSPRHQIQVDYYQMMEELASQFGVKPNLKKIFFSDLHLWYHLYFGPLLAYQYRLTGPYAWKGAREVILSYERRWRAAFNTRKLDEGAADTSESRKILQWSFIFGFLAVFVLLARYAFLSPSNAYL